MPQSVVHSLLLIATYYRYLESSKNLNLGLRLKANNRLTTLINCDILAKRINAPQENLTSGCGGIGIRARLRCVWTCPWEFESPHPHHIACSSGCNLQWLQPLCFSRLSYSERDKTVKSSIRTRSSNFVRMCYDMILNKGTWFSG